MKEEKQKENYPDCKKTCKMCLRLGGSEKLICPWLPCYYKQIEATNADAGGSIKDQ